MKNLILAILIIPSAFAQINFNELDGFVTGLPGRSLIKAELIDYNNDHISEIAYYFKNSFNYLIKVRDIHGNEYFEHRGNLDTDKTFENIELFKFNGKNFAFLLYSFSDSYDLLGFSLKVIDLDNNTLVDSIEGHTGDYIPPYNYNYFYLAQFNVIPNETGIVSIYLGFSTLYYHHEIGGGVAEGHSRSLIFNFDNNLYYSGSYINYCSNFFKKSQICYGYESFSSGELWGTHNSENFRIFHLNIDDSITVGDQLFDWYSETSSFTYWRMYSSDDSTNFNHPVIVGPGVSLYRYRLYGISLSEGTIYWDYDRPIDSQPVKVSANLTLNEGYYFILFSDNYYGNRILIFNRENGQLLYDSLALFIPSAILEMDDCKLYFVRLAGEQSAFLYELEVTGNVLAIKEGDKIKSNNFSLYQNYPNPFNPSTRIKYSIDGRQYVSIKVYDVLGKQIVTLVNKEQSSGDYTVEFNGSNLASGIYFYQLKAGEFTATKKLILLK